MYTECRGSSRLINKLVAYVLPMASSSMHKHEDSRGDESAAPSGDAHGDELPSPDHVTFVLGFVDPDKQNDIMLEQAPIAILAGTMPKGTKLWETPPAPVHMVLSSDFSAVADHDQISELFLTAPISQFPAMVPVVTMQDPRNWWSLMAAELDSSVSMVMEMNDLVIAVAVSQLTHPSTDEERGSWEDLASHVIQYKIRLSRSSMPTKDSAAPFCRTCSRSVRWMHSSCP